MKTKTLRLSLILHFTFFILHSYSSVPLRFNADAAHPATWQASAYRGETVAISAQLTGADGRPFAVPEGAGASMLWSTNGIDWFGPRPATVTTGGLVRATWTPDMDCGADSYRVFLRVDDGGTSNVNYRANLLLRMLGSPGAVPNELPLPAKAIDFAAVAVSNAPWVETESDPTVPAWAKAAEPPLSAESDPVFAEWAETNEVLTLEWLSPWSWPDEWSLSVEASGNTPAFSGYVPNKDVYAAVTAPGASFPTSWEAVVTPEACAIPGIVDPPEVSVSVDDPYGAVAAVTGNVAYASGSLGQFAFVASDTNGVERRAYVIAAPAPAGKTNELFAMEGDGTERWVWTTNVLARLNAVSTNAGDMVAHVQCRTASNRFDQAGTGTWMAPRALSRFGTGGRNYTNEWPASYEWGGGVANRHWCLKENEDFFWPELRTNLWCYTVNCHESVKPKWNFRAGSAIAVAPHYIVSATHFGSWMWGPGQTWTDSPRFRFGPGTNDTVFCRSPRQVVSKVPGSSDIELCRVTNDIPAQCIAHFAREATLRALSPTFFRGCPGFVITSHQTLAPAALSPYGFSVSWTGMPIGAGHPYKNYIPDDELVGQVPWLEHVTHMFDSASPFFLVAPNGRVVPVGQVYSTGGRSTGGPTYFDDDVLDAIDAAIRLDSGGAEGLSFWEFDDLWSGFGTNSVPEL
ncbi:MAG: hypothetical protein J6Y92_10495 [Lentisphaeria bacterium]|nr:hypothetical protein [Lentisphaeria bacterium]